MLHRRSQRGAPRILWLCFLPFPWVPPSGGFQKLPGPRAGALASVAPRVCRLKACPSGRHGREAPQGCSGEAPLCYRAPPAGAQGPCRGLPPAWDRGCPCVPAHFLPGSQGPESGIMGNVCSVEAAGHRLAYLAKLPADSLTVPRVSSSPPPAPLDNGAGHTDCRTHLHFD